MLRKWFVALLGGSLAWIAVGQQAGSQAKNVEWAKYGLDHAETHHSPLAQISTTNVGRLGLAWSYNTGSYAGQIEGTPLVANGVLYGTLPWSVVFAVDARTGKLKWRWDPQIPHETFFTDKRGIRHRRGPSLCCGPVNRGVAFYQGKVFVGLLDGRLVALDADTGRPVWTVQMTSKEDDYSITGAPRIVKGKVITGNSGAEFGVRGFVSAYHPDTGKLLWRFYTVPGDPTLPFENKAMEVAAKTWTGAWWKYGGGGTAWDGMAYDPELDLLYVGTGNGSPWPRDIRSPGGGDNLYLCSILALRPDTGEYVWHFQTTPADNWDYASTQPLILTDLTIAGRKRKVIMQAPKNGFFYVIDRVTGQFISAEAFTRVNWAKGIDPKSGRPIETPEADYDTEGSMLSPGSDGAHNWHSMSWNPTTGLVYIPGQETSSLYARDPDFQHQVGRMNLGRRRAVRPATTNPAPVVPNRPRAPQVVGTGAQQQGGYLVAWDPITQKERWRIRFKEPGITSGTVSTAGNLVFHGAADGVFSAYSADRGEKLWSVPLAPGFSNPITYLLDGKQYVSVLTGRSGGQAPGRLYTFVLDGKASIPSMEPIPEPILENMDPSLLTSAASTVAEFERAGLPQARGRDLIQKLCVGCHQPSVVTRYRLSEEGWSLMVRDMVNRGMGGTREEREIVIKYLATHLGPPSGN